MTHEDGLEDPALFAATPMDLAEVPSALMAWLLLEDSMTQAISERFQQTPTVAVHYSAPDLLSVWERQLLGGTSGPEKGFARHISLNIDEHPVLLARSVTHQGSAIEPLLSDLQNTPLAKILFEDEQWLRLGEPTPLRMRNRWYGRACLWQDQRTRAHLLVEEFFNFNDKPSI